MKAKVTKKPASQPETKSEPVYKTVKRFEGGVREAAQKAIPAKGATFDAIVKASKFPESKLRGYLSWMVRNGYLKPNDIVTHRVPLEHIAEAYHMFSSKLDGCIKPIIVADGS